MHTVKNATNQNSSRNNGMQPSYWSADKIDGCRKLIKFCREHDLTYGLQRQHNNRHVEYSNTSRRRTAPWEIKCHPQNGTVFAQQ